MDILKIARKAVGWVLLVLASMFSTITLQVLGVLPYPFKEGGLQVHPLFGFPEWTYVAVPLGLVAIAFLLFTADLRLRKKGESE